MREPSLEYLGPRCLHRQVGSVLGLTPRKSAASSLLSLGLSDMAYPPYCRREIPSAGFCEENMRVEKKETDTGQLPEQEKTLPVS
jgi:hypothetical protein